MTATKIAKSMPTGCGDWVRRGMDIVFTLMPFIQHGVNSAGANGIEQNTEQGAARRSVGPEADFGEMMGDRFHSHGFTYDRLESVDVLTLEKRGPGPHLDVAPIRYAPSQRPSM